MEVAKMRLFSVMACVATSLAVASCQTLEPGPGCCLNRLPSVPPRLQAMRLRRTRLREADRPGPCPRSRRAGTTHRQVRQRRRQATGCLGTGAADQAPPEFESEMYKQLGGFNDSIQGSLSRSDQAYFADAFSLGAAISGPPPSRHLRTGSHRERDEP